MPIRCACPHCGNVLVAPDERAGKRATCPGCRQKVVVPGTPAPAAPARAATVPVSCPGCGRVISLAPHELTTLIECVKCRTCFTPLAPVPVPAPLRPQRQEIYDPPPPVRLNRAAWLALLALGLCLTASAGMVGFLVLVARSVVHEAAPGVGGMTLTTYKSLHPKGPHTFTLQCQLSDGHWTEHWRETHYVIDMIDWSTGIASIYGTVPKDTPAGKRLFAVVRDGQKHWLKVTVEYDDDVDPHHDGVSILDVREP
jgi:hypothetical protein